MVVGESWPYRRVPLFVRPMDVLLLASTTRLLLLDAPFFMLIDRSVPGSVEHKAQLTYSGLPLYISRRPYCHIETVLLPENVDRVLHKLLEPPRKAFCKGALWIADLGRESRWAQAPAQGICIRNDTDMTAPHPHQEARRRSTLKIRAGVRPCRAKEAYIGADASYILEPSGAACNGVHVSVWV